MSDKCSADVWKQDGNWGRHVQCTRKATMEHEGKPFCAIHHPDKVKARQKANRARWEERANLESEKYARQFAAYAVCEGVPTAKLEELGKGWIAKQIEAMK